MRDLLSIYIPTYNRPKDMDRLLCSIITGNGRFIDGIPIYISSNNPEEKETFRIVSKWKEVYPYISYFYNNTNIGIDANHDKIYEYCRNSQYALEIADDDLLLEGALEDIIDLCKEDFLFALCNAYPYFFRGGIDCSQKIYDCDEKLCLKADEMVSAMTGRVIGKGMCPLLPFYGGIIVNVQYMNQYSTSGERNVFRGTFHQYIGALWNELLKNKNLHAIVTEKPLVAIGYDVEKKTWLDELEDTFTVKVPMFYEKLLLDDKRRKEILQLYQKRMLGK